MGITTTHLRKLGFKAKNIVHPESNDKYTLCYLDTKNDVLYFVPEGKTVIFTAKDFDFKTGEVKDPKRFVMMDEVGYWEMLKFLRSLRQNTIFFPKNIFIE